MNLPHFWFLSDNNFCAVGPWDMSFNWNVVERIRIFHIRQEIIKWKRNICLKYLKKSLFFPAHARDTTEISTGKELGDAAEEAAAWQCLRECMVATPAIDQSNDQIYQTTNPCMHLFRRRKGTLQKIGRKPRKLWNNNNWREKSISK